MIKISITEEKKKVIEKIYWNWFETYHINTFEEIIKNDKVLRKIIFPDGDISNEKIKQYLLSGVEQLQEVKARIEAKKDNIKSETEQYLLDRYKNFRNSQAAKIVKELGLISCPYCNQNHLNVVYDANGRLRYWGDLDHFYDKSKYPEMMICLYNMVPACKVCNQKKSSIGSKISNPYGSGYTSGIVFETQFDEKMDLDYLQGKSQNFNIVVNESNLSESDKEELIVFGLENRYKNLKRNAQEIIIKSKAYDDIYADKLKDKFDFDDEELKSYIYGYSKNYYDRILSKFNRDIMKEFE